MDRVSGKREETEVSEGREIKMHPRIASVSAKWKRSLQQLSWNSVDRYLFPSENRVRLSEAYRMRKDGKTEERKRESERKNDRQRGRRRATGIRAKEVIPTVTRNRNT